MAGTPEYARVRLMTPAFLTGIVGSLILVIGAALPGGRPSHPTRSAKNWFLSVGAAIMFVYSILNYQSGAPVFFVLLELLVVVASALLMLNVRESVADAIILIVSALLVAWSLTLFAGYDTLVFIAGLTGVAIGYVADAGSFRRELALCLGSGLIALFSFITGTWVFFWLNVFFCIFSAYHALAALVRKAS